MGTRLKLRSYEAISERLELHELGAGEVSLCSSPRRCPSSSSLQMA
jgi:hypothetical protein